jgi:Kef-type K+ transport system membrane component KefB
MSRITQYSLLLVTGLLGSQLLEPGRYLWLELATMLCMSYIMIHIGYEFEIDKEHPKQYLWDYFVAGTAASLPWIFCAWYFVTFMNIETWKEGLLIARFTSPTSAGVLLTLLAAAGLATSWVFRKARLLAIFDDIYTILLFIPLKWLTIGLNWQLILLIFIIIILVWIGWEYLHRIRIPITWPWTFSYALLITLGCEMIYFLSKHIDEVIPLSLEVLLPSFILGTVMARPAGQNPHSDDIRIGHQEGPESPIEQKISAFITGIFMFLVGLSMPVIPNENMDLGWTVVHVGAITILMNLGKMFPLICYQKETSFRERLALCIGMFPRGEAGARKIVLSMGYGLTGSALLVASWALVINLLLTGVIVNTVKRLIQPKERV